MGYNKRNTTLILIITIVSVLGLSIAFAAFSSSLTVKSNATITPDSGNFKVVFSSKSDSLSTTNVSVTKTENATAGTPTIDNTTNPTIKNLSASFTSPGEKTASRVSMPPFLDESYSRGVRPVIKLNKSELN